MKHPETRTVLLANPGADLYGSDRMALETVSALVGQGRRVVVTVPAYGPLVPLLQAAGADVVRCPTPIPRKGLLNFRGALTLGYQTLVSIVPSLRVLHRSRADTVIVNTITAPLWLALSRASGRMTLCHVHEAESTVRGVLRGLLYLPLLMSHEVIANSRFTLSVLRETLPALASRVTVVHNALDGPPRVVPPRPFLEGPVRLLYVGRLSHRKGVHVAVEALHLLIERGRDAVLEVVGAVFPGNEAYQSELQKTISVHGLESHVSFTGFRSSPWDEVAGSDIVLVPALVDESFGNTAAEAALGARPAIVSEVGGLPEACKHSSSSILIPPGNAEALADAVCTMVDDWPRYVARALADAGVVAEAFSSARYSREIAKVLDQDACGTGRTR